MAATAIDGIREHPIISSLVAGTAAALGFCLTFPSAAVTVALGLLAALPAWLIGIINMATNTTLGILSLVLTVVIYLWNKA